MKKLISLVLALAMIMMIGAVYAEGPVNNLTADTTISVTNLDEGDIVALYQIIERDATDGYWKPATGYSELTQADVDKIVGQNHETGAAITEDAGWNDTYINKVITGTLPAPVDLAPADENVTTATVGSSGTFTFNVEPGMYYVLVTPKDGTKIYKPMFVSADYSQSETSQTTTVAAKYETITIDKHATAQENDHDEGTNYGTNTDANSYNTVNIGDIVDFEIKTTIPKFPASFTEPIFNVADTLTGMELVEGSIQVYAGDSKLINNEYTLASDPAPADFVVEFDSEYIKDLSNSQAITVKYKAKVDNSAALDINMKENTAEVRFSNNPGDKLGANKLVDETRHYTFSINGLVTASGNDRRTDLIKVGVDADGNEIMQLVELYNEHWAGVLQGAEFTLWGDEKKTNAVRTGLTSDEKGQIVINGLDAGTYWIEETKAPAGYIRNTSLTEVNIIPVFEKQTVAAHPETINGITVTVPAYSYAVLKSYEIKIGEATTSTYTIDNEKAEGVIDAADDDQIGAGSSSTTPGTDFVGKIKNPKGTELPSTGGIGTTIFYILGGLLVIGAAVILIARRKAQD